MPFRKLNNLLPTQISELIGGYLHTPPPDIPHDFSSEPFVILARGNYLPFGVHMNDTPRFSWVHRLTCVIDKTVTGCNLVEMFPASDNDTSSIALPIGEVKFHKRYVRENIPLDEIRKLSAHFLPFHSVLMLLITVPPNTQNSSCKPLVSTAECWVPVQINDEMRIIKISSDPETDYSRWKVELCSPKDSAVEAGKVLLFGTVIG